MTTKPQTMRFIVIPEGQAPNARKMIAEISKKKSVLNMKNPVYYADENARIAFTDVNEAHLYAIKAKKAPRFVTGQVK